MCGPWHVKRPQLVRTPAQSTVLRAQFGEINRHIDAASQKPCRRARATAANNGAPDRAALPAVMKETKELFIHGSRGIPAAHGGFETFAEHLALYLTSRGWRVSVACQLDGQSGPIRIREWNGVQLIEQPAGLSGSLGSILFDWRMMLYGARHAHLVLSLGYNTALFWAGLRLRRCINVANMDGIEWQRKKWPPLIRAWFYLNEICGAYLANHLIADHPRIAEHLARLVPADKITTIPYGADVIDQADAAALEPLGVTPGAYALVVARPEPENSLLEIVRAFSARRRGIRLVVLGNYDDAVPYSALVRRAASGEVLFPGAIYDRRIVQSLRFHALFHIHGHQVGGTNPSLVEALAAGSPVLAHDNPYNRWVAGDGMRYFADETACMRELDTLIAQPELLSGMRCAARTRHSGQFTWEHVLPLYEQLFEDMLHGRRRR